MDVKVQVVKLSTELFLKYGFKHVTVDMISKHMGISKKTLYELFEDKKQIVSEVVELLINKNKDKTCCAIDVSTNAIEELIKVLESMQQLLSSMNPLCFSDLQRFYPAEYAKFYKYKREFISDHIKANLKRGINEKLYRDDLDIDIITVFRLETALIVFNTDIFTFNADNLVKINTEIFKHYLYGIATIKGHEIISAHLKNKNL